MKLKSSAVQIDSVEPFKHDQLNRKPSAEVLTALVESLDEPFVLSLEAGAGHGKSTFMQMWAQHLRNEGFTCLTFDAWENEFVGDPLIPFIAEISKEMSATDDGDANARYREELAGKLKRVGIQLARRAVPVAAKLLTAGLLDEETFEKFGKTAAEALNKAVDAKFAAYAAERKGFAEFRSHLEALLGHLRENGKRLPIVFLIDELDRCRPEFAIALLERLKQLFSVAGLAFVLAIDKTQVLSSVRAIYGSDADAYRYLRRFIDLEYTLPDPAPVSFAAFLMKHHGFDEGFAEITGDADASRQFVATFVSLSTVFGLRLRDQGHAFSILGVVWRTLKQGTNLNPFVTALLVVLKIGAPHLYAGFVSARLSFENLFRTIREHPAGHAFLAEDHGIAFEANVLLYSQDETFVRQILSVVEAEGRGSGATPQALKRAQILSSVIGDAGGAERGHFDAIVRRIEVTEPFSPAEK